jgi:hypothetical protein
MQDDAIFCPACGTRAGGDSNAVVAASVSKPANEKAGNIIKCPSCGAPVPAMTAVCPECGHEFRNVDVTGSVKNFLTRLEDAEKSGNHNAAYSLIKNFPIPNGKEDLLEFIIESTSRLAVISGSDANYRESWEIKLNQAYQKANIVLKNDKDTMAQIESLMEKHNTAAAAHEKLAKKRAAADNREQRVRAFRKHFVKIMVISAIVGGLAFLFWPTESRVRAREEKKAAKMLEQQKKKKTRFWRLKTKLWQKSNARSITAMSLPVRKLTG